MSFVELGTFDPSLFTDSMDPDQSGRTWNRCVLCTDLNVKFLLVTSTAVLSLLYP